MTEEWYVRSVEENWGTKEYEKEQIKILRSLNDCQLISLSKLIGVSYEDLKEGLG